MGITVHHRNPIAFHLSAEERDLILGHARTLDAQLTNRLRFGRRDGALLTFELSIDEFASLRDAVGVHAELASERKVRRSLARLHDKLTNTWNRSGAAAQSTKTEPFGMVAPELRDELQNVINQGPFASLEEANKALQEVTSAFNNRPREEFGGLSPYQVHRLLNTQWNGPQGAVQLADDLNLEELRDAPVLTNARILLRALDELDYVKATTAGNLNRNFVQYMLESMQWQEGYVEALRSYSKAINEEDVTALYVLRNVLGAAGVIRRTKGSFKLTRAGKYMTTDAEAGGLYALLFHTYFRVFNLGYLDRFYECPGVQHTIAYSFYALHRLANDWQNTEGLAERILLPSVLNEIPPDPYGTGYADLVARHRILEPLRQFGLIECTYCTDRVSRCPRMDRVRKTPLFDRFITFNLDA